MTVLIILSLIVVLSPGVTPSPAPRSLLLSGAGAFPAIDGRVAVWLAPQHRGVPAAVEGMDLSTGRRFAVLKRATATGGLVVSGERVVWVDCRSCKSVNALPGYVGTRILGRDLRIGRSFALGDSRGNADCPDISGRIAVWTNYTAPRGVFGMDLVQGKRFKVTERATCADIDHNRVAWQDSNGATTRLLMKDLRTGRVLTVDRVRDRNARPEDPRINTRRIIWTDWNADGSVTIMGKDTGSGRRFVVTRIPQNHFNPQFGPPKAVSGAVVVWEQTRLPLSAAHPRFSIYARNLNTGKTVVVASDAADNQYPDLSGNTVVWMRADTGAGSQAGVYAATLSW